MPCHSAIVKNLIAITLETIVEDALALMKKEKITLLPIVDQHNIICGYFSAAILLKNILPVPVNMGGGVQVDLTLSAAPGIAKRLHKAKSLPIETFMERKLRKVSGETPTWEGLKIMAEHGAPLCVVEEDTGKLIGMMTEISAIDEQARQQ